MSFFARIQGNISYRLMLLFLSQRFIVVSSFQVSEAYRSEGFPRTGYLIPGRDTPRAWSNTKSSWQTVAAAAAAVVAAVSWSKMLQIWAKVIFHENGHVLKFQDMLFSRNKSPCGSVPQKVTFSEVTLRELIHFYRDLKNPLFPKKLKLDCNLPIKTHFCRKPKWSVWSIRTTFVGLDWKSVAQKVSYGRKLTFWRGRKFQNPVLKSREGFWGFL